MNNEQPIEAELAVMANPPAPLAVQEQPKQVQVQITPAQAKVEAIASLTMAAYQRAATLQLTPEESAALQADFPDDAFQPGAAGKENLLYIEHAHLRDRFTQVFGMGQWAIVPRNRWAEPFRTARGDEGSRVYVEAMLIVRGCFVGEAVGAMEYYPKNAAQNYGDAVEGAKTAAFRRCAKEFGVGLQAWKKDWCAGWWARKRGQAPKPLTPTPFKKPEAPKPVPAIGATEKTREWMIAQLHATPGEEPRATVTEFFQKVAALLPNEQLEELPLRFVPTNKEDLRKLTKAILAFEAGEEAKMPYGQSAIEVPRENVDKPSDDPNDDNAPWRSFEMPFGKNAGTPLADLDKKYLYGLWANYEVEEEYNGKPKKAETIAKDREFRSMLDAAGEHYQFKKD